MFDIIIRCPETGMPVPTGQKTPERALPRSAFRHSLRRCPSCTQSHEWLCDDAWLVRSRPDATDHQEPELIWSALRGASEARPSEYRQSRRPLSAMDLLERMFAVELSFPRTSWSCRRTCASSMQGRGSCGCSA